MYKVAVQAEGEIRDAEGNLVSTTEVHFEEQIITEEQAIELGLLPPKEQE